MMAIKGTTRTHPQSHQHVLRALSDPTREKLLQLLLAEELSVTEMVEILRQPQSTVSRHLKVLRGAGLIVDRRNGTSALYRASEPPDDHRELQPMLLSWLKDRPLAKGLATRLQRVLTTRRDKTVGFFERLGNRWDDLRTAAFGESFTTEAFLALLPSSWTVVDVGTGTGFLLPALAEHFNRVIAIDPAAAMLGCARQRMAEQGAKNVTFHQGDLDRLPVRDRTCDLAIACLVLHHVNTPVRALLEMLRVLRPGGRLLIVEQERHEIGDFHETMQDHWWGFNPPGLAELVTSAGFESVRHHPLATASSKAGALEVPGVFVLTGERPNPKDTITEQSRAIEQP